MENEWKTRWTVQMFILLSLKGKLGLAWCPGTKTLSSQHWEPRSDPQSGNQIPHATTKRMSAATKIKDAACRNQDPVQPKFF